MSVGSISTWVYAESSATGLIPFLQYSIISIYHDVDNSKLIGDLWYNGSNIMVELDNTNKEQWYHVVLTYDRNEVKFYLDGGSQTDSANMTIPDSVTLEDKIYLCDINDNIDDGYYIDDVIIYDRALSEDEVTDIYNFYE